MNTKEQIQILKNTIETLTELLEESNRLLNQLTISEKVKGYGIGIDYSETDITIVVFNKFKCIETINISKDLGFSLLSSIIPQLVKKYDTKIEVNNNKLLLLAFLREHNLLKYIKTYPCPFSNSAKYGLGYNQKMKDLFDKHKNAFEYNKEYESATKLVVLGFLNE